MQNFSGDIWLVGGSVRAAAGSALRAGWRPICTDFFADADLQRMAQVVPVETYPAGLVRLSERLAPGPWLYTGGLENFPEIVAAVSKRHALWGNGADALRRVRDPFFVDGALRRAGLPALEVQITPPGPDGTWLRKPRRGSGGQGIVVWDRLAAAVSHPTGYFQHRTAGDPISALFLAWPGQTHLLEVTAQLVGLSEVYAPPFRWCGNIAPLSVSASCRDVISQIGSRIAEACALRGLFGCDFVLADDVPWLTEVNPRYTGSAELVEYLRRAPLLDWHRRACRLAEQGGRAAPESDDLSGEISAKLGHPAPGVLGKVIVYNARPATAADAARSLLAGVCSALPLVADVPVPGTRLVPEHPHCTVYARGDSVTACQARLVRRARRISARLISGNSVASGQNSSQQYAEEIL